MKTSFKFLSLTLLGLVALSGCTEARYAAHVVKQIPMPSDSINNPGYFKTGSSYNIKGRRYYPKETYNKTETGIASWYGPGFHGKMTANGEIFDENEMTAAHRTLQMPSIIKVTNLGNGRTVILRVNDRGPFAHDRVLDVSKRAATALGFKSKGTAKIRLEVLEAPSREVAARSKAGYATKGYEVALNRGQQPTNYNVTAKQSQGVSSNQSLKPLLKPEPITTMTLDAPNTIETASGTQISQPVPLRKPAPVESVALNSPPAPPSLNAGLGRIYVQAGSFSQEQNALNLSTKMASYGSSKVYRGKLNDQPFYRVRLGPYNNREEASRVIDVLSQGGNNNAVIVTE